MRLICLSSSRMPRPKPSTPQLLEITVRSLTPRRLISAIRFSGIPQRPKPPATTVMPLSMPAIASS